MLTTLIAAAALIAAPQQQHPTKPHPNAGGGDGPTITVTGLVTNIPLTSLAIWPQYYGTDGHYHAHFGQAAPKAEVTNDSASTITFTLSGTWTETLNARNGGGQYLTNISSSQQTVGPYSVVDVSLIGVPGDIRVRGGSLQLSINKISGGARVAAIGNTFAYYLCTGAPMLPMNQTPTMFLDLLIRVTDNCDGDTNAADIACDSNALINYFGGFNAWSAGTPYYYLPTGGVGGNGAYNLKQFLIDDASASGAAMDSWDTAGLLQICMAYEGVSSGDLELFQLSGQFYTNNIIPTGPRYQGTLAASYLFFHEAVYNLPGAGIFDPYYTIGNNNFDNPPHEVGDPEPYWGNLALGDPAVTPSYWVGVTKTN